MADAPASAPTASAHNVAASSEASAPIAEQIAARDPKEALFLPIYGHTDETDALCSLLRIEGVTLLLDCGWTHGCDPEMLAPLAEVAPLVDAVRFWSLTLHCVGVDVVA